MAGSKRKGDSPAPAPGLFDAPSEPRLHTVGELTAAIKARIDGLGAVRVEGELSGIKRAASGHVYFDLKDDRARISCAVWRSNVARALSFRPEEGAQVIAHGRLDVYPPRGTYSLLVERLEPLGIGALLAQLEKLKAELAGLGWFDRSRPLPAWPRPIGVVTSRDGAALRDFLRTRSLRWPGYPLRLCHTPVQGPGAAAEIADAIRRLDASGVDVIVVCRGGGSLEDLWAFNERAVAEAIHGATVPVVSGVGHETDTTLADLVADHRAHTPTDAAQTVIPDRGRLTGELGRWGNFLIEAMDRLVTARAQGLAALSSRRVLRDAGWILDERRKAVRDLGGRLGLAALARARAAEVRLQRLHRELDQRSPRARISGWDLRLATAGGRLRANGERTLARARERLGRAARSLEAISPLAVLGRGYSVTSRAATKAPLLHATDVAVGDEIETRLHRGTLRATVLSREIDAEGEG